MVIYITQELKMGKRFRHAEVTEVKTLVLLVVVLVDSTDGRYPNSSMHLTLTYAPSGVIRISPTSAMTGVSRFAHIEELCRVYSLFDLDPFAIRRPPYLF